MYAKVFSQIFDSSIAEDFQTRHVFMDLLVLADKNGIVDMTLSAISRRTNIPLDIVEKAVAKLCSPDNQSRTGDHEGRRLLPISDIRTWGWSIVNYEKYRSMRDDDGRTAYMREYMAEKRKSVSTCKQLLTPVNTGKHSLAQAEAEAKADTEVDNNTIPQTIGLTLGVNPTLNLKTQFEEFWKAYPRKVGHPNAEKAYTKALKRATHEKIMEGLAKNAATWTDKTYMPHPTTWLNRDGWNDEPLEKQPSALRNQSTPAKTPFQEQKQAGYSYDPERKYNF